MRLVLGMIVKNEEFFLKQFLPILAPVFDGLIAVDSFSTDNTVTILKDHGFEVIKGIKFLNKKRPSWHQEITLKKLDLCDTCNCILGQLYGSFWRGTKEIGLVDQYTHSVNSGSPYGFSFTEKVLDATHTEDPSGEQITKLFKQLTQVWKAEIRKFRTAYNKLY